MCKCSNVCKIFAPPPLPVSQPAPRAVNREASELIAPHTVVLRQIVNCSKKTMHNTRQIIQICSTPSSSAFPLVPDKAGNVKFHPSEICVPVLFPVTKVIFLTFQKKNMIVQVLICLTSQYMGSQKYSIFDSD